MSLGFSDPRRGRRFYSDVLGLEVLDEGREALWLGAVGRPFLRLASSTRPPPRADAPGLFHLAILYPDRRSLAEAVARVAHSGWPVQGASDHGVSEAVYLKDMEGNGVELYRDRPIAEWPTEDDHLAMHTLPLDLGGLLSEAPGRPDQTAPPATRLGHVHLRVREIAEAESFYRDALGLHLMQRYGASASFFSAGSYHHHVGVNTWTSHGADPVPAGAPGLEWLRIDLPPDERHPLLEHLSVLGIPCADHGSDVALRDPSGNGILL